MAEWVRVCGVKEAPLSGKVSEVEAPGQTICLANVDGELNALENLCPHRQGPLGQGWMEGRFVVCPWHAWAFDCRTGVAEPPESAQVRVFPVRIRDGAVELELD